jgi:hypothetical protein
VDLQGQIKNSNLENDCQFVFFPDNLSILRHNVFILCELKKQIKISLKQGAKLSATFFEGNLNTV